MPPALPARRGLCPAPAWGPRPGAARRGPDIRPTASLWGRWPPYPVQGPRPRGGASPQNDCGHRLLGARACPGAARSGCPGAAPCARAGGGGAAHGGGRPGSWKCCHQSRPAEGQREFRDGAERPAGQLAALPATKRGLDNPCSPGRRPRPPQEVTQCRPDPRAQPSSRGGKQWVECLSLRDESRPLFKANYLAGKPHAVQTARGGRDPPGPLRGVSWAWGWGSQP